METGLVTLRNTKEYPFNDSEMTVALGRERNDTDYLVLTETIDANASVGDVRVYDKATNGFRIAYSGSAKSADIRYVVTGSEGEWRNEN